MICPFCKTEDLEQFMDNDNILLIKYYCINCDIEFDELQLRLLKIEIIKVIEV